MANIHIVDDEQHLALQIKKKLINNGHIVKTSFGVNAFKKDNNSDCNLYILDIWLEDGTWFDIIKWLRVENNIKAPIILMSWYNDNDTKNYWFSLWANDFIDKPFSSNELLERINTFI